MLSRTMHRARRKVNHVQTKRDLGFIEGDLIECLNAGDGSWWMGRLKRDRRMTGLFPSNFVRVLDESFQPWARNASPMANKAARTPSHTPAPPPPKTKSTFRKPFRAYAAAGPPNPAAAAREVQLKIGGLAPTPGGSVSKHKPYSSMKRSSTESRDSVSPVPTPNTAHKLRAVSPVPRRGSNLQVCLRASSPAPPPAPVHRARSPAPSFQHPPYSRVPSPLPCDDPESPPPPPPPPHRVLYNPSRAPSPAPNA